MVFLPKKKPAAALADGGVENRVSSLQEPPGASISARKPAFLPRRQGSLLQFC